MERIIFPDCDMMFFRDRRVPHSRLWEREGPTPKAWEGEGRACLAVAWRGTVIGSRRVALTPTLSRRERGQKLLSLGEREREPETPSPSGRGRGPAPKAWEGEGRAYLAVAWRGTVIGSSGATISARRGSNQGGSSSVSPRCSFGSSIAKPMSQVATSTSVPPGERQ